MKMEEFFALSPKLFKDSFFLLPFITHVRIERPSPPEANETQCVQTEQGGPAFQAQPAQATTNTRNYSSQNKCAGKSWMNQD